MGRRCRSSRRAVAWNRLPPSVHVEGRGSLHENSCLPSSGLCFAVCEVCWLGSKASLDNLFVLAAAEEPNTTDRYSTVAKDPRPGNLMLQEQLMGSLETSGMIAEDHWSSPAARQMGSLQTCSAVASSKLPQGFLGCLR